MSESTDDIFVSREHIECEACGKNSPQKCCARCHSYYYCSKKCQIAHWREHKPDCTYLKDRREDWEKKEDATPSSNASDTIEGPCAICFEETVTNPVVLDCNHVFCFGCIGQYHYQTRAEDTEDGDEYDAVWLSSCPCCRREIPNAVDQAFQRGRSYYRRAEKEADGSDKQKRCAELALVE